MKHIIRLPILLTALCSVLIAVYSSAQQPEGGLSVNNEFYQNFIKTPPILRDDFLEMKLNSIIHSRGTVKSIDMEKRYRRNYRVILTDNNAQKMNLQFTYYVFLDNKETVSILSKDMIFEFSGQLMAYTPLSSRREEYILDVILEKGAVVVE